jgi:hypothetical protein
LAGCLSNDFTKSVGARISLSGMWQGNAAFAVEVRTDDLDKNWQKIQRLPFEFKEEIAYEAIKRSLPKVTEACKLAILRRYKISRESLLSTGHRATVVFKTELATLLESNVIIESSRLPVMRFSVVPRTVPPQKGIPISARTPILVGIVGPPAVHKGWFLAKMASGHVGVFQEKKPREWSDRTGNTAIEERFMISATEMLGSRYIQNKLNEKIEKILSKETDKAIEKAQKTYGTALAGDLGETYGGKRGGKLLASITSEGIDVTEEEFG